VTDSAGGTTAVDLDAGLRRLGYDGFRSGQREAVEVLLDTGRLLLVAPTGGGKSLTYQLPAAMLPGTTLVISPLIALMHDQVTALNERGLPATYLAGTLDAEEARLRLGQIARGEFKLVYVAPERLVFDGFRDLLSRLECPLIAVDEAHCISEWGHDFRPEYMQIGQVLQQLPEARVLACTATATPIVRDEILERLGLPATTPQHVHGFARPNLAFRVLETQVKAQRVSAIDELLRDALTSPGNGRGTAIIYAPTRKATEEEAERLRETGWGAAAYHAGLAGELRARVQTAFAQGQQEIVVATNAFGMGIDRSDVRCIGHLGPPGSVEAYYQEAGRAGRDGEAATCLLLVSPGDMPLRRRLIEMDVEGRVPDPETVEHRWNMFLELMRYAEGGACRHDAILRYFGDEEEVLSGCGRCDNCLRLDDDEDPGTELEVSDIVRKALCGAARVHGRFGLGAAARLLRGGEDLRLQRAGLADTSTFGILSDRDEDWLVRLLSRCVTAGWLQFGEHRVVYVTDEGYDVIHGRRPVRLLLPSKQVAPVKGGGTGKRRRQAAAAAADLDEAGRNLFDTLRAWRLETASGEGKPPYVVASDRTLRDIATLRPADQDELLLCHGIGPAKVEKYSTHILRIIAEGPNK
jgi:ATP-dependent DNA helicase RecQ